MTDDDYDDLERTGPLPWEPKTPKDEREALGNAPSATLRATPASQQAAALMRDLALRYSRPQAATGKTYARGKTLVRTREVLASPIYSSLLRISVARTATVFAQKDRL